MKKNEKYYKTHMVKLTTSKVLWRKFDNWWREQGCTTRSAGLRLAMRIAIEKVKK